MYNHSIPVLCSVRRFHCHHRIELSTFKMLFWKKREINIVTYIQYVPAISILSHLLWVFDYFGVMEYGSAFENAC